MNRRTVLRLARTAPANFTGHPGTTTMTVRMMTGKDLTYRAVAEIVDDDNQIFAMYFDDKDGNEFKSMEMKYTRK